jgi:hypothetical protein
LLKGGWDSIQSTSPLTEGFGVTVVSGMPECTTQESSGVGLSLPLLAGGWG